jgi:cob(I)alamin adenosyltransferase
MTKIYTKTGDDGTTGLFGGGRVPKSDSRVQAYGAVDELNSQIGLVRSMTRDREVDALLARVQADLFALGADLATPERWKGAGSVHRTTTADAVWLEEAIDRLDTEIPVLQNFILPGGEIVGASTHVARAVCRRAERAVVALSRAESVSEGTVVYLNRLSDFLFTLARVLNRRAGVAEEEWKA